MSVQSLMSTPCTLYTRVNSGDTDDDGNAIYDREETQTVCSLQQIRRDEPGNEGELSVSLWNLYLPAGTDVSTADAVFVNGETYELVGEPWNAVEGSAAVHHVEATVRKTAGAGDTI